MESQKLLAIDLDGTLISSNNKISKKNLNAMKNFINQGNKIVFITGRPFYTTKTIADYFLQKTGLKIEYIVALKGAVIYDNINEKIMFEAPISYEDFNEVYNIALKNNLVVTAYSTCNILENKIYCYNLTKVWKPLLSSKLITRRFGEVEFNNFNKTNFFKLNLIKKTHKPNLKKVKQEIDEKINSNLDVALTNSLMIEVTHKNINKGFALRYLADHLNWSFKDIIAFGDSGNDIPMLDVAGTSVIISKKKAKKMNYVPDIIVNKPINSAVAELINIKHNG